MSSTQVTCVCRSSAPTQRTGERLQRDNKLNQNNVFNSFFNTCLIGQVSCKIYLPNMAFYLPQAIRRYLLLSLNSLLFSAAVQLFYVHIFTFGLLLYFVLLFFLLFLSPLSHVNVNVFKNMAQHCIFVKFPTMPFPLPLQPFEYSPSTNGVFPCLYESLCLDV